LINQSIHHNPPPSKNTALWHTVNDTWVKRNYGTEDAV